MHAHLLFRTIPESLTQSILDFLREEERDMYKTALATLAVQRKLRPVFVQRKPVDKQMAWIKDTMKLRTSDGVGEHVLQVWFLKAKTDMLILFLDEVGIEHDGKGSVDDLPETIDEGKLKAAVEAMLKDNDADTVALYLHVFQLQTSSGWPAIAELLESDARFSFGAGTSSQASSASSSEAAPEESPAEAAPIENPSREDSPEAPAASTEDSPAKKKKPAAKKKKIVEKAQEADQ